MTDEGPQKAAVLNSNIMSCIQECFNDLYGQVHFQRLIRAPQKRELSVTNSNGEARCWGVKNSEQMAMI